MALYRLSVKLVKEHVSSKVAYIEREGKYSKGTKAEELRENWSADLPSWAENSQDFWRDIELEEKPGQVQARGIELALPVELSKEEQRVIVEEFSNTVLKNHARTIAIHDSKDGKNPHVHIYFTERKIDDRKEPERGKYCRQRIGYSKDRSINGAGRKQWLLKIRKEWENIQNRALENAGFLFDQVSCESLEAQGIQREAQIHVGYQDTNRYRKTGEKGARYRRNEAVLTRNRDYIAELTAAEADVKRLEKAVKEEKRAKEEAVKKAAEAARIAAKERQRREAEEARRRADDAARKAKEEEAAKVARQKAEEEAARLAAEEEAARKAAEAAKAAPENRWISDDTIFKIAAHWLNNKNNNFDMAQMEKSISRIMPGKIDFSKVNQNNQERLCEAARVIMGDQWRGLQIKKPETARRIFAEILAAAKVPEKQPERAAPERAEPERQQEPEKRVEIVKIQKKEKNRGMER